MMRCLTTRLRVTAATALALAVCGALAGCGSSGASGSDPGGQSITLYSGQHEQTTDGLVTAFEKQTGITVNVRNDDEDTLANLISVQGSHSPADVFYTENSPALVFLQGKGLLSPVDAGTLAKTPAKYNSTTGDWVAVSARVSVLIYNPSLIAQSQLPTSVMQMADPQFKGKFAVAAGETDFQPIVTSVIRTYGQAAALRWLDGIKSNAASHLVPDNETIADEVNRGPGSLRTHQRVLLVPAQGRDRRVGDALADHLLRPARPGVRDRRVRRGGAEVEQAPGGRAEVPGLPGQPAGRRRSSRARRATSRATSTRSARA